MTRSVLEESLLRQHSAATVEAARLTQTRDETATRLRFATVALHGATIATLLTVLSGGDKLSTLLQHGAPTVFLALWIFAAGLFIGGLSLELGQSDLIARAGEANGLSSILSTAAGLGADPTEESSGRFHSLLDEVGDKSARAWAPATRPYTLQSFSGRLWALGLLVLLIDATWKTAGA